jgi:hypothetical protein
VVDDGVDDDDVVVVVDDDDFDAKGPKIVPANGCCVGVGVVVVFDDANGPKTVPELFERFDGCSCCFKEEASGPNISPSLTNGEVEGIALEVIGPKIGPLSSDLKRLLAG